jgi:hypothetical protein
MTNKLLVLFTLLLFASCAEKKSDKNLIISGTVKGLKKGTLYIQKIQDTSFVILDTIVVNGDSNFKSEMNIDEPEMMYLFLDRGVSNSLDNNIVFFAEKGKITINTSLDFFTADAKITGSKNHELYEEYKKVVSRYIDQDMELIRERIYASKEQDNQTRIQAIEAKRENIVKSKYLYTTNFAVNNRNFEVAPYVALAEIYDINLKYLDTIQKSLSPKVAKSMYGKKLDELIKQRKIVENKE